MRQIRFRAKRMDTNKWIYGDISRVPKICSQAEFNETGKRYVKVIRIANYNVREETVGQSTGLLDVNGKEIYEGDIVDWTFFYTRAFGGGAVACDTCVRGCIDWQQGGFILSVIKNDFECAGYYPLSSLNTDTESDVTIIGNRFDSPELAEIQGEYNEFKKQ